MTTTITVQLTDEEATYVRSTWAGFLPSDRYLSESVRAKIYDAIPRLPEVGKFYTVRFREDGGDDDFLPEYRKRVEVIRVAERAERGLTAYIIDADGDPSAYVITDCVFEEVQ